MSRNDYWEGTEVPINPVWDSTGDAYELLGAILDHKDRDSLIKLVTGYAGLHDPVMKGATANDLRAMVSLLRGELDLKKTPTVVESTCSQLVGMCTAPDVDLANVTGTTSLRGWYKAAYPDDELWQHIDGRADFFGLYETLKCGEDVYDYFGVGDSIVRERLFEQLAAMMNRDYEYIYEWWLHHQAA